MSQPDTKKRKLVQADIRDMFKKQVKEQQLKIDSSAEGRGGAWSIVDFVIEGKDAFTPGVTRPAVVMRSTPEMDAYVDYVLELPETSRVRQ